MKGFETPKSLQFALYDRIASRYIGKCRILVGWSQVSLCSFRRAKKRGILTVLEHPMIHVRAWMRLMRKEYAKWKGEIKAFRSLFPSPLIRRMLKEYEEADVINVLSTFAKKTFISEGVPEEKIFVTPLGVDVKSFCPSPEKKHFKFVVLYVGRMELLKGVHYLLQAFAELRLPNAELWLVGASSPEILPFFRRYEGFFRYIGEIPHSKLPQIYQQAFIFVLPSIQEGFGLVILEAMACGIPVIATHSTGAPDVIRDGVDGFIIPPCNVEALKEHIEWAYNHRNQLEEMGENARQRVCEAFTWEHYGERVVNLFQLLNRSQSL